MADIFILNYLEKTLKSMDGTGVWSAFKRKQSDTIDLTKADLENHDLSGYDLANVNLTAARLYNANLTGADLTGAVLTYADMRRADISSAYLSESNLSGAVLESVNAIDTNFENAKMHGSKMRGAHLAGASFGGADLANADLRGANLKYANMLGAKIKDVRVEEADLTQCRLDEEGRKGLLGVRRAIGGGGDSGEAKDASFDDFDDQFTETDCRKILGVDPEAGKKEITKAYKQKVLQYHPDKVRHLGEKLQVVAKREFERVQRAYRLLSADEEKDGQAAAGNGMEKKSLTEYSLHDLMALAKANPNNDRVFYNLGLKFFENEMFDKAIRAYERAVELNPQNHFAEHNLKIVRLTKTLGVKGK